MLPVVNSVIGNYRSVHLSSVYLSEVRRSKRDLAYRESEVLAVLTQNARVRVQLSPNLPELLVKSLSLSQSETVEVESSLVKNLLYKEGVTLSLVWPR